MLQIVEHDAWLYARRFSMGIDVNDRAEMPRHVDDDSRIAALSRQARPTAARQYRYAVFAADLHSRDDIIDRSRHDNRNRHLSVVRGIGGV